MSTTFIIILLIAVVMAIIGISMNRSRTGRQRHDGAPQQRGGDRSRDASADKDRK